MLMANDSSNFSSDLDLSPLRDGARGVHLPLLLFRLTFNCVNFTKLFY